MSILKIALLQISPCDSTAENLKKRKSILQNGKRKGR